MKRKLVGILVALVLALVGTVSLVGYVEKAKNDAIDDDAQVKVLVVQRDIPAGATLAIIGNAVLATDVPKRLVSPDALTSLDNVDPTLVAGVDLKAGEQLLASRLVNADDLVRVEVPEGLQEITLALDPERAVGGARGVDPVEEATDVVVDLGDHAVVGGLEFALALRIRG